MRGGLVGTDLHVKPTDKHQYLRMDSCHLYHSKTSIPYSQALRLRRICSEEEHLLKWTRELKKTSTETGILRAATEWWDSSSARYIEGKIVCNYDRAKTSLLELPLEVTYHPILPSFQSITKRHLPTLQTSERLRDAFLHPPLIAFRRPRNLRDLLVRAPLNAILNEMAGNRPCRAAGCKTCPILTATDEFTSYKTGQKFKMKFAASCKSSNIIYLITCRRCGQQYVGKTGQPLHRRVNGHRFKIVHRRTEESPVAVHFNGEGHSQAATVVAMIDQLYSHNPCLRKIRESRWIRILGTSHPSGMNLRVDSLWNLLDNHLWDPLDFTVAPPPRHRSCGEEHPANRLNDIVN